MMSRSELFQLSFFNDFNERDSSQKIRDSSH